MSLKNRAVIGALWTIATSIGGRAVGLVGTLLLTRFLAPAEYGTVSVAAMVVATVNALTSVGFGQYVVANPREGDSTVFHATFVHVMTGAVALGGVLLVGESLGPIFGAPDLARYIPGIVAATFVERAAYIPGRVLARDMRFRVLGLRLFAGEVAYSLTSVGLAMAGFGAAALVWGIVARAAATALVTMGAVERKRWLDIGPKSLETLRRMTRFGAPMTAANVMYWLSRRGDNLLMAGMFGPATAGQYNLAYNLADIPAAHIGEQIGDVLLPSFAKMKDDEARKRALIRAAGMLALLVFPLAIGLGVIAPTLVRVLFDARWAIIAPMLLMLSALSVLRPLGWMVGAYLQAMQQTRHVMVLEAIKTAGVLSLVPLLGQLGPIAACAGIGLAFGANAAAAVWLLRRDHGLPALDLVAPLFRPLLCCIPLAAAVIGVRTLGEAHGVAPLLGLGAELAAGAIAYIGAALVAAPRHSSELIGLVRTALLRRAAA